jgi:ubiquinone/menaquinone biosynthesis C-methylase UbiE
LRAEEFTGTLVGLDASWPMLAVATDKLQGYDLERQVLLQGVAGRLPFAGDSFDLVTCLEALEFFPQQEVALREMVRVLRPGAALLVTRRTGHEGRFFLHRYRSEAQFVALLGRVGLTNVRIFNWEVGYDLAIGWKAPAGATAVDSAAGLVYNEGL